MFIKETNQVIREQESFINDVIKDLSPFELSLDDDRKLQIIYQMHFTMLDGKVSNILSNTNSTATCYICGATPKLMNTPTVTKRPATIAHYRFGLSTLHAWIRCFECLLHISYRLLFKTWEVKEPNKAAFAENKSRIQREFKSRLGLVVDKPKPGYGSSTDGNTARRFLGLP